MNYIIVSSEYLEYVNFAAVEQTSPGSLRYSLDKKHFLLKYKGEQPDFVFNITQDAVGLEEYNHEEILKILNKKSWTIQD
jgi:hypothetical protein|tara:strand:+ start:343 stop:582 length:240 start_codon:yes stop_codon:yes gene_type:complete